MCTLRGVFVFFILAEFLTSNSFAAPPPEKIVLKWKSPRGKQVRQVLYRIANEAGEPVILSHAMTLSAHSMFDLGRELHAAGFDPWMLTMRGHGLGDKCTTIQPYTQGDYRFDWNVVIDYPHVVQHIREKTGKKIHLIGHSMGGMTWEQYLGGVQLLPGEAIGQSDALAKKRAEDIASFTALAVPVDLGNLSTLVKFLIRPLRYITRLSGFWVPIALDPNTVLGSIYRYKVRLASPALAWLLPSGIINPHMTSHIYEFDDVVLQALSATHSDYLADFIDWFDFPYASHDKKVDYGTSKHVLVPTLQIVAGKDSLAVPGETYRLKKMYPSVTPLHFQEVPDAAHLDIVMKKARGAYRQTLLRFMKNPPRHPEGTE